MKDACNELGLILNDTQIQQFMDYKDILLEWNEKINLTAITDDREVILKHFVDSLTVCRYVDFANKSIIDVGTGAGFPAIPIKIFCPSAKITLLDSLNKRITFLKELCNQLDINDVTYIHSRAEDGGQNKLYREKYDYCVSRAVANLNVLAEYDLPFVKVGGEFIALKGPLLNDELKDAKKTIDILGGSVLKVEDINIPYTDICHRIVFIQKLRQTPNKYPRKAGKLTKTKK